MELKQHKGGWLVIAEDGADLGDLTKTGGAWTFVSRDGSKETKSWKRGTLVQMRRRMMRLHSNKGDLTRVGKSIRLRATEDEITLVADAATKRGYQHSSTLIRAALRAFGVEVAR